jgi:hypothetical protein
MDVDCVVDAVVRREPGRQMGSNMNQTTAAKTRRTAYWATTGLAALALGAAGAADLLRVPAIMESLAHLGYPAYFVTILGTGQLLGAAAILAPGLPRVKEWAYAGIVFTLTGAALSHAAFRDPVAEVLVPLALLCAVIVSWALRPAHRTSGQPSTGMADRVLRGGP